MLLTVEGGEFVFNVRGVEAPWLAWASQMADLTHAVPSLFRHGPLDGPGRGAGVWTAAVVVAWLAARGAARAASLGRGSAALVALCALGVAVTAAVSAAWRIEGVGGTRVTNGQLRALETASRLARFAGGGARFADVGERRARPRTAARRRGACAAGSADVWMALPFLPAGRYRMWADVAASGGFDVHLVAGRSEEPFESWFIERRGAGAVEPRPRAARRSVTRARTGRCGSAAGAFASSGSSRWSTDASSR